MMKIQSNRQIKLQPMRHRVCAVMLAVCMLFSPVMASAAAPAIPGFYGTFKVPAPMAGTLPVPRAETFSGGTIATNSAANQMTITQNQGQSSVVIDWNSFNIAAGSSVRFYQGAGTPATAGWTPNRDYAALNRIYDSNPSQIYGSLAADGKIYLINRNGILFGPGSQVNVHALAASALNITKENFSKGLLRFTTTAEADQATPLGDEVTIANHGTISTDSGGSVSLIGPQVENAGSISAPQGSVNLVGIRSSGGSLAEDDLNLLTSFDAGSANVIYNAQANPGSAVNFSSGYISADSGRVGMYGDTVRQGGIIRSVSAVKRAGEIFLKARSRVTTEAGSLTETPVSSSPEKVNQTFSYNGGTIQTGGLTSASTFVPGADGSYAKTEGPLQIIEHNGGMTAPSGTINLAATERIFMGGSSSIDVAGEWVDQPAAANLVSSTLNSVEMRDFYVQKYGDLMGEKIWSDLMNGSAIGDISGSYAVEEKSALERSTRGGIINLTSGSLGQIIMKEGAVLDISGGGFRYAQGSNPVSMLAAGNRVFDIASAPQSFDYSLLDSQSKSYARFGITETFKGLYYGGGSSVYSSSMGRIAGSDAGSLSLLAEVVKLDGAIHADVSRGIFQTKITPHPSLDVTDSLNKNYFANIARGLERPVGGTLLIGADPGITPGGESLFADSLVAEIVVKPSTVPLPAAFEAGDQLGSTTTELSAALLSGAGLGTLSLFSNTNLTIEAGAHVALASGGIFTAKARSIEQGGEVVVPGGSAAFVLQDNITAIPEMNGLANPRYVPISSNLHFAPASLVSVSGETIDNTRAGRSDSDAVSNGLLNGGKIAIRDLTVSGSVDGNNLTVARGATLDVSGGYLIDQSGRVNGGDAGSLELRATNLSLGGDLRGLALPGKKGGEITLHSGAIVVGFRGSDLPGDAPPAAVPSDSMTGRLLLSQNRFDDTGFTRLNLIAVNDVIFKSGTDLKPSTARLPSPVTGSSLAISGDTLAIEDVLTSPDYLGQTSIKATAGTLIYGSTLLDGLTPIVPNLSARILVDQDALLGTTGGGIISLTASGVDIAGTLSSPGGTVSITARGSADVADLNLLAGGRILASGYNKPDGKAIVGTPASFVPQAAGSVSLAASGSVNLHAGSIVDLSGADPAELQLRDTGGAPQQLLVAGNPGSLSLTYSDNLTLDGTVSAAAHSDGVIGGTLTLRKTAAANNRALEITAADVALYQASGFDALSFASSSSIILPDAVTIAVGRSLTLDSPVISGSAGSQTTLQTPWLRLINSSTIENLNPGQTPDSGGGQLTLAAKALDITGNLQIRGFENVRLESARDITFTDRINANSNGWIGNLWTTGNLTLQAQRIYPTTASQYTLTSNGKVTILPQGSAPLDPGAIYSAGGSLNIEASGGIEHRGLMAAPLGNIKLDGMGNRVYLAEGSSILTGGSVPVSYGYFDGNTWSVKGVDSKGFGASEVTAAPDKSVNLSSKEVIVREGASIDSSGGGSIYSTLWQAGLEGSVNPFTKASNYVILSDNSLTLPGRALYLEAAPELGLKAGVYSILPAEFAFLPGALVIQETGTRFAAGTQARSAQGYTMVGGYATVTDTAVSSPLRGAYVVRRAEDVATEGNFTRKQFVGSDGGAITVSAAETAIIAGSLKGTPLAGGQGAVFSLSGANVQVKSVVAALESGFAFDTPMSPSLAGTMQLEANSVSNKGLKGLRLGDGSTDTVTIESGSVLQVPEITLTATNSVLVESGAQVLGSGADGAGTVTVNLPVGTFTLEENAEVRASHGLSLNVANIVLNGELTVDNSTMNLSAENIFFVPDTYQRTKAGLYLNETLWSKFSQYEELNLKSSNDMVFQRDVTLTATGALSLDAGRMLNQADLAEVKIQAQKLSLLNSGATRSATPGLAPTGEISLSADTITVSSGFAAGSNQGGVLFDGFGSVNLTSSANLLLQGAGSIATAGDLKVTASRLAASSLTSATGAFLTAADFQVTSGGKFSYDSAGTPGVSSGLPGGNLAIKGSTIRIAGLIDMPSGNFSLAAVGSGATDGVYLATGARIQTQGAVVPTADARTTVATPGGRVVLAAAVGPVEIAAGAVVDVAAAAGSDAGSLALSAPGGQVTLAGELRGNPATGDGASFEINSRDLTGVGGLDGLSATLADGGFNELINIHSRSGDLALANGSTLSGREVVVAADGGAIDLSGRISADGVKPGDAGGRVELYAGSALNLQPTAVITAKGVDAATGGAVVLSSASADKIAGNYALQAIAGSAINVSGGAGGTVSFRAYELAGGSDINMASLPAGAISGAARVSVEETRKYTVTGNIGAFGAPYNSFMSDANLASVKSRLFANVATTDLPGYHLLAGIELVGDPDRDLILDTPWDLTSVRPGGEAGVVTLRAAANLDIAKNLVDKPTALTALRSDAMTSSWGINLVAGADLQGANPLAVIKGQGNLILGPMNSSGSLAVDGPLSDNALGGALVYTENAPINFVSGNNTDIGYGVPAGTMINTMMRYNIGSYGGRVHGVTGGDLTVRAGAIQTAISDIDLRVAGDLNLLNRRDGSFGTTTSKNLSSTGSIRTSGEYTPGITKAGPDFPTTRETRLADYWTYAGGGSIYLDVNGTVAGQVNDVVNNQDTVSGNSNAWDTASGGTAGSSKYLTANYLSTDSTEGIATLAGGDVTVLSGKGFTSQVGTFGSGDLTLVSGGDMNGRYRTTDGSGSILALGNFGAEPQVLELGAAQLQVVALGDVNIGAVLNPDNTRDGVSLQNSVWDLGYDYQGQTSDSLDSAISLISLAGATSLSAVSTFDGYETSGSFLQRQQILPPVTEIITAGDLQINGQFALAPSPSGDLRLIAAGNINNSANSSLAMVDVPLDKASPTYAYQRINTQNNAADAQASLFTRTGINLLHQGDPRSAEISSGPDKDIVNLHLNIDKPVAIQAGRDISELVFSGQNLAATDVTSIRAGRDIVYSFSVNQPATALEAIGPGIKLGGPGELLVQAGRNIDLGNSTGIQSVGGFLNPPLGDAGASVTVIAGAKPDNLTTTAIAAFFHGVDGRTDHADLAHNGLIKAGAVYSEMKDSGDTDAAREQLDTARSALIRPMFDEPAVSGEGYITMTSSQINSLASGSDVRILARGSLDVGKSSLGSSSQQGSGISTAGGGSINIYTGKDVNVNESRIMSYLGGDISVWVDQGDLNAGRGLRTSISPSPPRKVYDPATKTFITKFSPPALGSGIRAVTFDPNTTTGGPLPIPEAGNINVYVPNGKIDAGEAGIVTANKLTLAATEVVNVKNIVGGAGSVGVPVSTDNSVSLGALGGNSSLTESSKMMETASTGGLSKESAQNKLAQAEDFLSKYLDVRVTSFDTDESFSEQEKKEREEKKKEKK